MRLGIAYLQSSPVPSAAGSFAINLTGSAISKGIPIEQDITGEVIANAGVLTGTLDINNASPVLALGVPHHIQLLRRPRCIWPRNHNPQGRKRRGSFKLAFYLVSTTSVNNGNAIPTILLVDLDSNRVSVGELDQQF